MSVMEMFDIDGEWIVKARDGLDKMIQAQDRLRGEKGERKVEAAIGDLTEALQEIGGELRKRVASASA